MVRLSEVQTEVATRYGRLDLPVWPDPHPGVVSPQPEEYSRVSHPERYRIVPARALAWAETLDMVPGVERATLAGAALDGDGPGARFDQGVQLTSARPGTLSLLLLLRDAPATTGSTPVLRISAGRPPLVLQTLPDCGCDACDRGSAGLLEAVDQTIGDLVGGPSVLLRGPGWYADWHPDGASSGGGGRGPDHVRVLELCRRLAAGEKVRLPRRTEAFVGRPWIG